MIKRLFPAIMMLLLVMSMSSCLLFKPKTVGLSSAKEIATTLDSIADESHIEKLSRSAVEGALSGMNSEASQDDLNKIGKALGDVIEKELTRVFQRIDTRTPGTKFAKGITDSLINITLRDNLQALVSEAIANAEGDISAALDAIQKDIALTLDLVATDASKNIGRLSQDLEAIFSVQLRDSISHFITDAINNVEYTEMSSKLSKELLSREFRDTLGEMILEIREKISFKEEVDNVFERFKDVFVALAIFITGLILAVSYIRSLIKGRSAKDEILAALEEDPELRKKIKDYLER